MRLDEALTIVVAIILLGLLRGDHWSRRAEIVSGATILRGYQW